MLVSSSSHFPASSHEGVPVPELHLKHIVLFDDACMKNRIGAKKKTEEDPSVSQDASSLLIVNSLEFKHQNNDDNADDATPSQLQRPASGCPIPFHVLSAS